jgi:hypothetical protein
LLAADIQCQLVEEVTPCIEFKSSIYKAIFCPSRASKQPFEKGGSLFFLHRERERERERDRQTDRIYDMQTCS